MCLRVRATGRVSGPTLSLLYLLVHICGNPERAPVWPTMCDVSSITQGHQCLRSTHIVAPA